MKAEMEKASYVLLNIHIYSVVQVVQKQIQNGKQRRWQTVVRKIGCLLVLRRGVGSNTKAQSK